MAKHSRRELLHGIAGLAPFAAAPWLLKWDLLALERGDFAQALVQTPAQTEGPFYPRQLPLDTDNDLLIINNAITPAVGAITHFSGRVLDMNGSPVRNAVVEIWQVDHHGVYLHTGSAGGEKQPGPGTANRVSLSRAGWVAWRSVSLDSRRTMARPAVQAMPGVTGRYRATE